MKSKKGPSKRTKKKTRRKGVMNIGGNQELLLEHRELEYLQAVWHKKGQNSRNEESFIDSRWRKLEESRKGSDE